MKVTLMAHTANPERLIACAAKLCYAKTTVDELYDGLTDESAAGFVEMLAGLGHESPIEHVSFTFGIEGVSRALLAQITRHRLASFSVQSQRYVKKDRLTVITPPAIAANPDAAALFQKTMDADLEAYCKLTELLQPQYKEEFLRAGKSEREAATAAEKKAIEDARFVLPNACDTQMMVTMNARSLYNFFRLRCCNRAQWEIRALADEMLRLVCEVAPTLFAAAGPACYAKGCSEGKMTCGQAAERRAYYKKLHEEARAVYAAKKEEA